MAMEKIKPAQAEKVELNIETLEEAREIITKAIDMGEFPVITVPEKYAEAAKKGLSPHTTWIEERILAGTIIRPPFLPSGERRRIFQIKALPEQVEPRFTGPDRHFHGVIIFRGPIPPDIIEEIAP